MEFPDPPYELYRPYYGTGKDPRKVPPKPPTKRIRVFGKWDDTNDEVVQPPPAFPYSEDSFAKNVGEEGGPSVAQEFKRLFVSLNQLLLEKITILQSNSKDIDLSQKTKKILQRKAELQYVLVVHRTFCCY